MQTITDTDTVTLTIDPHGPYPHTMRPERFDVVCDAIGLRGLGRKIGQTRLAASGVWTFTIEDDAYRMQVV